MKGHSNVTGLMCIQKIWAIKKTSMLLNTIQLSVSCPKMQEKGCSYTWTELEPTEFLQQWCQENIFRS